jgi:hypothetical protein
VNINIDDFSKFLDQLGQKLTPTAQHVFELAVRNQIITGIQMLVAGLLLILLGTAILVIGGRLCWKYGHSGRYDAEDGAIFGGGFVLFGSGVGLMVGLLNVFNSLPYLLNPEWMALKDIMASLPK